MNTDPFVLIVGDVNCFDRRQVSLSRRQVFDRSVRDCLFLRSS
jgi:hypothetical protein